MKEDALFSAHFASITEVGRNMAKEVVKLGVRIMTTVSDSMTNLVFRGVHRQGYIESGHPEIYNALDHRLITVHMKVLHQFSEIGPTVRFFSMLIFDYKLKRGHTKIGEL